MEGRFMQWISEHGPLTAPSRSTNSAWPNSPALMLRSRTTTSPTPPTPKDTTRCPTGPPPNTRDSSDTGPHPPPTTRPRAPGQLHLPHLRRLGYRRCRHPHQESGTVRILLGLLLHRSRPGQLHLPH